MPLTPSKRHNRVKSGSFVQTSPASATFTLTGLQGFNLARGAMVEVHTGDGQYYISQAAVIGEDPTLTITHRDINAALVTTGGIVLGARGTLSVMHMDADNGAGAGGGAYTIALAGIIIDNATSGQDRRIADATLTLRGVASDGTTSPLTFTAA